MTRDSCDLAIIVALEEEFAELYGDIRHACRAYSDPRTNHFYYTFEYKPVGQTFSYQCVATFIGGMGPGKAQFNTQELLARYHPTTTVLLGIAGGINDDVKLGDVVAATQVDGYYETAKAKDSRGRNRFSLDLSGEVYRSSVDLINFITHFRFAFQVLFETWRKTCADTLAALLPSEGIQAFVSQDLIRTEPQLLHGHIASGPIVGASSAFSAWLKARDRKLLAIEMEAVGLLTAVYEALDPTKTLILRGISDFGDKRKSRLDNHGRGVFRRYAMRNAIRLLWSLLDANALPRGLSSEKVQGGITSIQDYRTIHNLGNRPTLIGREEDVERILRTLSESRNPIVIYGSPGIGKTSIAMEVAYRCVTSATDYSEDHFSHVLYFTARHSDLTLTDIFDGVGRWTGNLYIVQLSDTVQKYLEIKKVLGGDRILIVIDNLDTITDVNVHRFLNDVPYPSRILVTHRGFYKSPDGVVIDILLDKMLPEASETLIARELKQIKDESPEYYAMIEHTSVAFQELKTYTHGNPLAIEWAVAQLRTQPLESVVGSLAQARGDLFEDMFERSWSMLDEPSRIALMSLTLFATPPTRQSIVAASSFAKQNSHDALDPLVGARLMEIALSSTVGRTRYSLHPLTNSFASAKLRENVSYTAKIRDALIEYYLSMVETFGGRDWEDPLKFAALEEEKENVFLAAQWAVEQERWTDVIKFAEQLRNFTLIYGYWAKRIELCEQASSAAQRIGDTVTYGRFRRHIGWTMVLQGRITEASTLLEDALKIAETNSDLKGLADAVGDTAELARLQRNFRLARELRTRSLALAVEGGSKRDIYVERTLLALLDLEEGELQSAKAGFLNSFAEAKEIRWHRAIAYCQHWLGDIARLERDFKAASEYYTDSLQYLTAFQDRSRIALVQKSFAFLSRDFGEIQRARELGEHALSEMKKLGLYAEVQDLEDLLDSLERLHIKDERNE